MRLNDRIESKQVEMDSFPWSTKGLLILEIKGLIQKSVVLKLSMKVIVDISTDLIDSTIDSKVNLPFLWKKN